MGFFTEQMGLPWLIALRVIVLEFFGPLLLVNGYATRPVAAGFAALMVGAIATVHWGNGSFINLMGIQSGEGFEYHLIVLGLSLALLVAGSGRLSLDRVQSA